MALIRVNLEENVSIIESVTF